MIVLTEILKCYNFLEQFFSFSLLLSTIKQTHFNGDPNTARPNIGSSLYFKTEGNQIEQIKILHFKLFRLFFAALNVDQQNLIEMLVACFCMELRFSVQPLRLGTAVW